MVDVAIIGGGLAGSVLATTLFRQNIDVALIESKEVYPECFKAEKLEPDQWRLLEKHELLNIVRPVCEQIDSVQLASAVRVHGSISIRQYGYLYHNLVNAIRNNFAATLKVHWVQATGLEISDEYQTIRLANNTSIKSRLVIVATGGYGCLHKQLGVQKRMVSRRHSFNFGFYLSKPSHQHDFDSLTYHGTELRSGADYLALFRIPGAMRANLFTYWIPGDDQVKLFSKYPVNTLSKIMPRLSSVLGEFDISGAIERFSIDLFTLDRATTPGAVFVGDAFQSVCPATGTGLSKVLTDVDIRADRVLSDWLTMPGMGTDKIQSFYDDHRKADQDSRSLKKALKRRRIAIDYSDFRFRLESIRQQWQMAREFKRAAKNAQPAAE